MATITVKESTRRLKNGQTIKVRSYTRNTNGGGGGIRRSSSTGRSRSRGKRTKFPELTDDRRSRYLTIAGNYFSEAERRAKSFGSSSQIRQNAMRNIRKNYRKKKDRYYLGRAMSAYTSSNAW